MFALDIVQEDETNKIICNKFLLNQKIRTIPQIGPRFVVFHAQEVRHACMRHGMGKNIAKKKRTEIPLWVYPYGQLISGNRIQVQGLR